MIPLRDSIPSRTVPVMNYVVIALCSFVFVAQLQSADSEDPLVERYGMVPARLSNPAATPILEQHVPVRTDRGIELATIRREISPAAVPAWMTVVTCMFLHGGWMHFLGNMWFLYIFGDNVEDRLGHFGYVLLYLGTGIAAGLAHYVTATGSAVPTIGASGAIAGVMGAYAFLYPHARVLAIVPLFVVFPTVVLPAPIFLGIWFVIQTISGVGSVVGQAASGVAWWAHIGGFLAGGGAALLIGRTPIAHDEVRVRRF